MNATPVSDPQRRVIAHLKRIGASSTQEVAFTLGISDVAGRQHLVALERQGLVKSEQAEVKGRGRPAVIWTLSPLANDLFPDRHDELTIDLIGSIRSALGENALQKVIEARTSRQLASLRTALAPSTALRDRLEALARQRTARATWRRSRKATTAPSCSSSTTVRSAMLPACARRSAYQSSSCSRQPSAMASR